MTQQAEYLYRLTIGLVEPFGNCIERCLIVKRTPERVVFQRVGELIDNNGEPLHPNQVPDGRTQFVDRQVLEHYGRASPADSLQNLYLSFDRCRARNIEATYRLGGGPAPDLAALKAAMAAAHPDKGGTAAAFIEAQRRYVTAKRGSRTHSSEGQTHEPG